MIISRANAKNFIFYPNGKCGTTSIEIILRNYGQTYTAVPSNFDHYKNTKIVTKHIGPLQSKNYAREYFFKNAFKFSFVRNPWDKVVSLYNFHKKTVKRDGYVIKCRNIKEYILASQNTMDIGSQLDWLSDNDGNLLVDFIGRFENLQNDFDYICDKIGIERQILPHANKTNHDHYSKYYNDETNELIEIIFEKDIKHFGYKL